jgi:hypothetical protein
VVGGSEEIGKEIALCTESNAAITEMKTRRTAVPVTQVKFHSWVYS